MRGSRAPFTRKRFAALVAVGALVWLGAGLVCLMFGQVHVPAVRVLDVLLGRAAPADEAGIVLMRLPRVLLALVVGGGLATVGATFQAVLRNPLATPHTLGVSSGGALGAVLAIALDLPGAGVGPLSSVQACSLAGSLLVAGVIYALARRRATFSPMRLLLAGVTIGLVASAVIMFVRFASDPQKLVIVDRWLMGGLDVQGYRSLAALLLFWLPAMALLMMQGPALNQLSLGEEMAAGRGVNVQGLQVEAFAAGSVLTAAVVSVAGPIGFVGLIVPHALRGIFGPDHRSLLVLCCMYGGAFLACADTVARSAFAPSELPVGVLTAMLGGPFFLALLVSGRTQE